VDRSPYAIYTYKISLESDEKFLSDDIRNNHNFYALTDGHQLKRLACTYGLCYLSYSNEIFSVDRKPYTEYMDKISFESDENSLFAGVLNYRNFTAMEPRNPEDDLAEKAA
jgi:hypothetical protein